MLFPFNSLPYKYDLDTFACRASVKKKIHLFCPVTNLKQGIQCVATQLISFRHTQHYNTEMCFSIHNAASST